MSGLEREYFAHSILPKLADLVAHKESDAVIYRVKLTEKERATLDENGFTIMGEGDLDDLGYCPSCCGEDPEEHFTRISFGPDVGSFSMPVPGSGVPKSSIRYTRQS